MRKLPKKKNYEPPIVENIEVKVEEGFAASDGNVENPVEGEESGW